MRSPSIAIRRTLFWCGVLLAMLCIWFFISWRNDSEKISLLAGSEELASLDNNELGQAIEHLTQKVYMSGGFAKNQGYYIWDRLGPTPPQIMANGGDCADKSRLLATILEEHGIDATLVMLKSCQNCSWRHTVVEARRGEDFRMAIDPVYNIVFPRPDNGYYGIEDLRASRGLLESRLNTLVHLRGRDDKVAFYGRTQDGSHYDFATTINLDKNSLTRIAKSAISPFVLDSTLVKRPRFLEDPKLFLTLLTAALSFTFFISTLLFGLRRKDSSVPPRMPWPE